MTLFLTASEFYGKNVRDEEALRELISEAVEVDISKDNDEWLEGELMGDDIVLDGNIFSVRSSDENSFSGLFFEAKGFEANGYLVVRDVNGKSLASIFFPQSFGGRVRIDIKYGIEKTPIDILGDLAIIHSVY